MLRDEETMELRGTYTSLQQEVEVKTKKLKKVRCHSRMGSKYRKTHSLCPRQSPAQGVCALGLASSSLCLNC